MPLQVIAECRTRPEHGGEPVAKTPLRAQRGTQFSGRIRVASLYKPGERRQREIGIGGGGDRREHIRISATRIESEYLGNQLFSPCGVGETHPGERASQRARARRTHP